MLEFLKQNTDVRLDQLSYTTTARRMHYLHRVMLVGSRTEDICDQLELAIRDDMGTKMPKSAPRIVFAFTGNGAQYPGMGRELLELSLVSAARCFASTRSDRPWAFRLS